MNIFKSLIGRGNKNPVLRVVPTIAQAAQSYDAKLAQTKAAMGEKWRGHKVHHVQRLETPRD